MDAVFSAEETSALTLAIVAINGWNRLAVGLGSDVMSPGRPRPSRGRSRSPGSGERAPGGRRHFGSAAR